MRKSPFSTPRGSGNGRGGFGWNSGGSPARGYGRPKNFEFNSQNRSLNSPQSFGEDFIPFASNTTPSSDRKSTGSWSSPTSGHWQTPPRGNHRQSSSPGFNNRGNNRVRENHRQSPYYKDGGNSFHGNRKSFHRGSTPKKFEISSYVNLQSFLEDPWAELSRKLSKNKGNSVEDSPNETLSDLSFNSSGLEVSRSLVDSSIDEGNLSSNDPASSLSGINDSGLVESESLALITTSGDSVETSCSQSSLDPKTSQDSKD